MNDPAANNAVNILMVDDQPNNLVALDAVLGAPHHNLVRAGSGPEALRALLKDEFALILLDVLMPGMDGFETAALIRQRDRSSRTPIIFLTAIGRSETHMFKGYSVGAVDYLFKPIEPEILRSKVAVFVDLFRKTQEVRRQAEQLREHERLEHERQLAEARRKWEAERQQLALNVARAIQQRLFPASPPPTYRLDIHGVSRPAETMGGDYFDYIPFADDSLGVVVGDVSGHGIGPAMLMAGTRAYLHAFSLTQSDVAEILAMANQALVADFDEYFVTLLLARIDPLRGSLVYSNAGHPSGYILSAAGDIKHVLDSTSTPLGVVLDAEFPASEAPLSPGDLVLLYTDGLVEACDAADCQFGVERALDVVRASSGERASEIVRRLYLSLDEYAGPRRDDDVTVLVIKVEN